jgi:carboxylesterase
VTAASPLDPSGFLLEGGRTGALLLHGFTGAPPEVRLIGEYLAEQGLTVLAPRLPGHGTSVEDLARARWTDWTGCAEKALAELRERVDEVFVGGLSMGSLLALHLAAQEPDLRGVLAWSPALQVRTKLIHLAPLLRRLIRSWPKPDSDLVDPEAEGRVFYYDRRPLAAVAELLALQKHVRPRLARVTQPIQLVQSHRDRTVHSTSARQVLDGVGSAHKELLWLHHSGHNILVDGEWVTVARHAWRFVDEHRRAGEAV